jgi:hypothetical protein
MKVVKLNRRFRMFKEHGHTVALRFSTYGIKSQTCENVCKKKLGGSGWNPDRGWYSYFGSRNGRHDSRPYWITFRSEADATLVLLSANLTQ